VGGGAPPGLAEVYSAPIVSLSRSGEGLWDEKDKKEGGRRRGRERTGSREGGKTK